MTPSVTYRVVAKRTIPNLDGNAGGYEMRHEMQAFDLAQVHVQAFICAAKADGCEVGIWKQTTTVEFLQLEPA